jgi:hypothetical protein
MFTYVKEKVIPDVEANKSKREHLGDLGKDIQVVRCYKNRYFDLLLAGDELVGFALAEDRTIKGKCYQEIEDWYVTPSRRRAGLGEQYLYFIKNVLKKPILLGSVHSSATQEFLKKHAALKRFNVTWFNQDTGETEPFDQADHYELTSASHWRVILEADEISTFDRYYCDPPKIKNSYSWLFDGLESNVGMKIAR